MFSALQPHLPSCCSSNTITLLPPSHPLCLLSLCLEQALPISSHGLLPHFIQRILSRFPPLAWLNVCSLLGCITVHQTPISLPAVPHSVGGSHKSGVAVKFTLINKIWTQVICAPSRKALSQPAAAVYYLSFLSATMTGSAPDGACSVNLDPRPRLRAAANLR